MDYSVFWWVIIVHCVLAIWRHYTFIALVRMGFIALGLFITVVIVGGWKFPEYVPVFLETGLELKWEVAYLMLTLAATFDPDAVYFGLVPHTTLVKKKK
jgi:hypothetical protein